MAQLALTENYGILPLAPPTDKKPVGKFVMTILKQLLKNYSRPVLALLLANLIKAIAKTPQEAVEFCMDVTQHFDSDLDGQAD